MKSFKFLLFLEAVLIVSIKIYAQQNILNGHLQTPNVSSLGVFGQIPVGHFTGVPQINIPFYTLQEDNVGVDISLNYHTSLVKPENHPGWVGLGWSLNAGGAIIRIPHGSRDESDNPESYNNNYSLLDTPNWDKFLKQDLSKPSNDLEPDEFQFNFGKYTGTFFKNHKGEWQVRSSTGVSFKINAETVTGEINIVLKNPFSSNIQTFTYSNRNITYYSFSIITEEGVEYIFGGNNNAIEGSNDNTYNGMDSEIKLGNIDTWLLTKIIAANKSEINFEYKREGANLEITKLYSNEKIAYSYNTCGSFVSVLKKIILNSWKFTGYECSYLKSFCSTNRLIDIVTLKSPAYLKSITSDHCKISFYSSESKELGYPYVEMAYEKISPLWIKLDSISIKSKNDSSQIKKIDFSYTSNTNERLKLLSVNEHGRLSTNNAISHTFHYNTNRYLPDYGSRMIDHWGFYNGKAYSNSTIESDRSIIDSECLKAEVLDRIIYPTGGSACFEYEPHDFSSYMDKTSVLTLTPTPSNNTIRVGGLRVKSITLKNADETIIKKTDYLYVKNYDQGGQLSSGILAGMPHYFESQYANANNYYLSFTDRNPGTLSFTNGSHITYSEVVEKTNGIGYTIHSFSNFDTGIQYCDQLSTVLRTSDLSLTHRDFPIISKAYVRGKPIKTKVYNNNNKLVKEVTCEYSQEENEQIRFYSRLYYPDVFYYCIPYSIPIGAHQLTKEITKIGEISLNNFITSSKSYTYNSQKLVSSITEDNSNSTKLITKLVYPFEMKEGADMATMTKMTDKNILSNYIEKVTYRDNGRVVDAIRLKFKEFYPGIFKPEELDKLPVGTLTEGDLYPALNEYKSLTLESGLDPDNIIVKKEYFTIQKYATTVNLNMFFQQKRGFINYSPISICYILTIKDSSGKIIYYIEASDSPYGSDIDENKYEYNRNDNLMLDPGTYTVELTHRGRYSDFSNLNVWHWGWCNISFTEKAKSMSAQYSLLRPEAYYKYDSHGNITEYKLAGSNLATTYIWSYNFQYPVAKIEGLSYDKVDSMLNSNLGSNYVSNLAQNTLPTAAQIASIRSALNGKNALITTFSYIPLVGITSVTDPREVTTNYTYDTFNRLYLSKNDDKNIISRYRYGYQNTPVNGQEEYTAPVAVVTPGATTYNYGSNGNATLSGVSGGSGSYTYNWYLKNSTGTVLASNLNTTSTSFTFTCSQGGLLTIQCVITDNTTGLSSTPSSTISSNVVTVNGSFTPLSGYTYPYTSLSKTGNTVTFFLVFIPTNFPMIVGSNYYVANVSAGFQPSVARSINYDTGGRTWNITFNPNGSVYCRIVSGNNLPVGSGVGLGTLSYNL